MHRSAIRIHGNDRYHCERRASVPDTGSGRPRKEAVRRAERGIAEVGHWDYVDTPERACEVLSAGVSPPRMCDFARFLLILPCILMYGRVSSALCTAGVGRIYQSHIFATPQPQILIQ